MPGRVQVNPAGEVSGWAYRRSRPERAAEVEVLLDGQPLVRLATAWPVPGALVANPRARQSGFSYPLPSQLQDGRVHEVRARLVRGEELAGSPSVWEPRRQDAPARSFVVEREAAASRRSDGAIPLVQDGWLRFDRGASRPERVARGDQLVQNREDVGGAPEHRGLRPWPAYLAGFRDHVVDPAFGGVYRRQGGLWQGSTYLSNSIAQGETRRQVRASRIATAPAERCFLLCNSVKDTYFHWHLDCLAGLVMARDQLGQNFLTLGPSSLKAWQQASLDLLGETIAPMPSACRPSETLVASHLDGRGIAPDRWVGRLFQRLKRAHLAGGRSTRGRGVGARVFVSRRDADHRVLENEAELWGALAPLGFARFTPGEASYGEQIEAFSCAEVVVASHGSALTNIGFCRPRTQIVEIMPATGINGCFRYLAIARELRHAWYTTDLVDPFRIDVEDFMAWSAACRLF